MDSSMKNCQDFQAIVIFVYQRVYVAVADNFHVIVMEHRQQLDPLLWADSNIPRFPSVS